MLSDKEDGLQARDYQRLAQAVSAALPALPGPDRPGRFTRHAGAGPRHFAPPPKRAAARLPPAGGDARPPHQAVSMTGDDAIPPPLYVAPGWPNGQGLALPIPCRRVRCRTELPGDQRRGIGRPAALLGWKAAAADRLAAFATEDA